MSTKPNAAQVMAAKRDLLNNDTTCGRNRFIGASDTEIDRAFAEFAVRNDMYTPQQAEGYAFAHASQQINREG